MTHIPPELITSLLRGNVIAAEINPKRYGHRAWISIWPKVKGKAGAPVNGYWVEYLEVNGSYNEYKPQEWPCHAVREEKTTFMDIPALENELKRWLTDFNELTNPWNTGYPKY